MIPKWLERAGSSVAEMTSLLQPHVYSCFMIGMHRGVLGRRLVLRPVASPTREAPENVIWLPADGEHWHRLERFFA
jgi:hypothetical protein